MYDINWLLPLCSGWAHCLKTHIQRKEKKRKKKAKKRKAKKRKEKDQQAEWLNWHLNALSRLASFMLTTFINSQRLCSLICPRRHTHCNASLAMVSGILKIRHTNYPFPVKEGHVLFKYPHPTRFHRQEAQKSLVVFFTNNGAGTSGTRILKSWNYIVNSFAWQNKCNKK